MPSFLFNKKSKIVMNKKLLYIAVMALPVLLMSSTRPLGVWCWRHGSVSRASIHADLVWMKDAGLGGACLIPVEEERGLIADGETANLLSSDFWNMIDYAFLQADSLGLEIGIRMSDDFALASVASPKPEEMMQKVVWTDSIIKGSKILGQVLLRPESYKDGKNQPIGREDGYYEDIAAFAVPSGEIVSMNDVVCLKLEAGKVVTATQEGKELKKLPRGNWRLIRIGHTSVGQTGAPGDMGKAQRLDEFSPTSARKLFASCYESFFERPYADVIKYLVMDSTDDGCQTWGYRFAEEFEARRGYDLLPYLPVMVGVKLESAERYEEIWKDIRLTIHELIDEKYVRVLADLADEYGLEVWYGDENLIDVISRAHVYGKNPVLAEGFVGMRDMWSMTSEVMKQQIDHYLALGANKLYFRLPDRKTWHKSERDLIDYVANCQKLLQQGSPVVDIAVFEGEEEDSCMVKSNRQTLPVPSGYKYDFMDKEALLRWNPEANYKARKPERQDYRILVVPQQQLSAEVKNKIEQLREAGVVIVDNLAHTSDFTAYGISPDVILPTNMDYAHRQVLEPRARKDIYFLVNQEGEERSVTVTFRTQNVAIRQVVKLSLPAYGSAFVVLSDKDGIKIFNPSLGE